MLGAVHAAEDPNPAITIVMGISRGGIADVITRAYAERAAGRLGQIVLVENEPSESGDAAASRVQNANPDGHMLLAFSGAQLIALPRFSAAHYDPLDGFQPVTTLFTLVNFLVVPSAADAHSLGDLLALGRRQTLTFGSSGLGSTSHLTAERMAEQTGIAITVSHYAGAAPMIADLVNGRLDFAFASYAVTKPFLDRGALRLLAVDADRRWPALAGVPTLSEAGLSQAKVASWFALAAPRGTPDAAVQRLYEAFAAVGHDPGLVEILRRNGALAGGATPIQTQALMQAEEHEQTMRFRP